MDAHEKRTGYSLMAASWVFGAGSILLLVAAGSNEFIRFGWSNPAILAWDAFLSCIFFLQHSGMIRGAFQNRLASSVPAQYYRAVYSIASGIALVIVVVFWQKSETEIFVLSGALVWIARACSMLAAAVFLVSIVSLRSFDPLGVGPIRARLRGREPHASRFVVRGPYRWVRHPLYACVLVLFWANPNVTADRLLFNVLWTAWIIAGTIMEERDLAAEFGDAYMQYRKQVPMLIPWRRPMPAVV